MNHKLGHLLSDEYVIRIEEVMWKKYWCDKCGEPMHDCKQNGCDMD